MGAEIAVNQLLITAQKVKEVDSDRDVSPLLSEIRECSLSVWL